MLSTERCAYSAIRDRRSLALSGGARLAVRVIVHIEEWNPPAAIPRSLITPLVRQNHVAYRLILWSIARQDG